MKAPSLSKSSPPNRPREEALGALDRFDHQRRLAHNEWEAFRPAGGHVHDRQRLDEGSRNRCAAMRNQIGFAVARRRCSLVIKRAYGNLAAYGGGKSGASAPPSGGCDLHVGEQPVMVGPLALKTSARSHVPRSVGHVVPAPAAASESCLPHSRPDASHKAINASRIDVP